MSKSGILLFVIIINQMTQRKVETVRSIIKRQTMVKKKKSIAFTFACQCGKKYSTYPALYLHFKRSHNIKINTKIQGKSCQTTQLQDQRIFTYFFTGVQKQTQDNLEITCSSDKNLKMILEEFLKQSYVLFTFCPNLPWVLCQLYRFVITMGLQQNLQLAPKLPTLFNQFAIQSFIRSFDYKIYSQLCYILVNLGQWLYKQGYTKYLIEMQDGPVQI